MTLLETLDTHRLPQAVEIAALAEKIRGFGHVKMQAIKRYQADLESALQRLENGQLSIDQRKKQKGERYLMADGSSVTTPHTVQYASTL
jgi:hypothetical protein